MGDGSLHRNDEPGDTDALIEALRDERSRRFYAEQQEAAAKEKAATWRRRAEERAERIKRLESSRDWKSLWGRVKRRLRRVSQGDAPPVKSAVSKPAESASGQPELATTSTLQFPPTYATVRAGVLASEGVLGMVARELEGFSIDTATEQDLLTADVLLLRLSDLANAKSDTRELIRRCSTQLARPPFVVELDRDVEGMPDLGDLIGPEDVVVSSSPEGVQTAQRLGLSTTMLEPAINPRLDRPQVPVQPAQMSEQVSEPLVVLHTGDTQVSGAWQGVRDGPVPGEILSMAARGVPVVVEGDEPLRWPVVAAGDRDPSLVARELTEDFDALLRASTRVRRKAHRLHRAEVRAHQVLAQVGIDLPSPSPRIGVLLVSNRPADLTTAITGLAGSTYPRLHLVVGTHGFEPSRELSRAIEESSSSFEEVTILEFDSDQPLGACLNRAAESTGAPVLAKIDDDDAYGPGYLEDQAQALRYSGADLVGKLTRYVYLEEDDTTYLVQPGHEEKATGYVPGPTFLFRRSAWEASPFPHRRQRVDSIFVRGVRAVGAEIYSSSRLEFVLTRRPHGHTWEASPERWRSLGEEAWPGRNSERAFA